jgi:hypothetical protein
MHLMNILKLPIILDIAMFLGKLQLEIWKSTLKKDMLYLLKKLKSITFVALTSDIWSGNAQEEFFYLLLHIFLTLIGSSKKDSCYASH